MASTSLPPLVDIVVPIFNEEEAIERFQASLLEVLESLLYRFHVLYINDGSSDRTQEILERLVKADARLTIVEFSRNFGHQAALSAGLDLATGAAVITMDGDGQHPPSTYRKCSRLINEAGMLS